MIKHRGDLTDAVKIILEINEVNNEVLKSDKVNNDLMELLKT